MATLPPSPFSSVDTGVSAETLVVARSPQAHDAAASTLVSDSDGEPSFTSDEAAALNSSQAPGAAADIPADEPYGIGPCMINDLPIIRAENERRRRELIEQHETDCIGEIFAGAAKLFDPDPAAYTREDHVYYDLLKAMDDPHTADLIDMPYGMEGIFDPPPLFIQQQKRA